MRNCTRDEGGPFGFGDQELIPSHRELLRPKSVVVSVAETPGCDSGRHGRERRAQAVLSGLERDGDACDLVTFLLGFLPPAAQQLQQCVLIDRDLLQRLALNTRNNASDEPTRL